MCVLCENASGLATSVEPWDPRVSRCCAFAVEEFHHASMRFSSQIMKIYTIFDIMFKDMRYYCFNDGEYDQYFVQDITIIT